MLLACTKGHFINLKTVELLVGRAIKRVIRLS